MRPAVKTIALAAAILILGLAFLPSLTGQSRTAAIPRLNGKPDLNGIWQALNTANWDIQAHTREGGARDAARAGRPGARERSARARRRRLRPRRPRRGRGRRTPLQRRRTEEKQENQENWLTRDPEIKCYLPGVPRATYMPFPFQIVQSDKAFFISYEFAGAVRNVF